MEPVIVPNTVGLPAENPFKTRPGQPRSRRAYVSDHEGMNGQGRLPQARFRTAEPAEPEQAASEHREGQVMQVVRPPLPLPNHHGGHQVVLASMWTTLPPAKSSLQAL